MTLNHTSAAVEQMRKGGIEHLASRPVRVAIAKRYLRMEEALREIATAHQTDYADWEDLATSHERVALLALAYDPLSTP